MDIILEGTPISTPKENYAKHKSSDFNQPYFRETEFRVSASLLRRNDNRMPVVTV